MTAKTDMPNHANPALAINCKECGASPGERCSSRWGAVKAWGYAHMYRRFDFAEGKDPGPTSDYYSQLFDRVMPEVREQFPEVTEEELTNAFETVKEFDRPPISHHS